MVDKPPTSGLEVFDAASAPRTPVLAWTGRSLDQVDGPDTAADVLAGVVRQVTPTALTFQHAADGAETLLQAAAAYERLARTTAEMTAAGGRLVIADDGLLHVSYVATAP